jgi:hypothetical protein
MAIASFMGNTSPNNNALSHAGFVALTAKAD